MSFTLFRQKRSGNWSYDLTVNGQRERKSTGTTDKKLAEDIAAKREWELRRAAVFGTEAVMTFGVATSLYLDAGKSPRFVLPVFEHFEHVLLKDIKPGSLHAAARAIYPEAGPATRNRQCIAVAAAIINHAAELGHCGRIRVRRLPVPKPIRKAVDRTYIDRFCQHASPDLGALVRFQFQSGCRIGAATALEWNDVSLQDRTIRLGKDKNGDPHIIHLTVEMLAALANLPQNRRKVFGYASRHAVYGMIRNACGRAGLEYLGTHQPGRHSFATEMMIRNGIDPVTTAKLGNWKSPRVLMENYGHPENEAATIERVFGKSAAYSNRKVLK